MNFSDTENLPWRHKEREASALQEKSQEVGSLTLRWFTKNLEGFWGLEIDWLMMVVMMMIWRRKWNPTHTKDWRNRKRCSHFYTTETECPMYTTENEELYFGSCFGGVSPHNDLPSPTDPSSSPMNSPVYWSTEEHGPQCINHLPKAPPLDKWNIGRQFGAKP